MSLSDRVAQLHPQAPGNFFVASYDSQGYGGGILTFLHAGPFPIQYSLTIQPSHTVPPELLTAALLYLTTLSVSRLISECGAVGGMRIGRGN
jgi:hypothetical protein